MPLFASLIVLLVKWTLWVLHVAMFARTLVSLIAMFVEELEDMTVTRFLHMLTEPLIIPFRALFNRMGWFQNSPIDMPFYVTFILLSIVTIIVDTL